MSEQNTRIIFWGTPEFALPALRALLESGYRMIAIVTNPDEPSGRKNILMPPPVKMLALKHKIDVFQPENLNEESFLKELPGADLFIVAAYGKIVPKSIIDKPKFGALNIHPSLLPRWRGPSPIQYAILHNDQEIGVTIMKMDEGMDHGPILGNSKFKVQGLKLTYKELYYSLAELGAELLTDILPQWISGEITPIPQDDSRATYSRILKKDDGRINWSRPAEEIERMVRAFNLWPGTWTLWPSFRKIFRVKIEEASFTEKDVIGGSCGYVWLDGEDLCVKTGRGSLVLLRLTVEGKKSLSAKEFLKGYGYILGNTLI